MSFFPQYCAALVKIKFVQLVKCRMCVSSVCRSLTFMAAKCWTSCFWIWDFLLLWRSVSSERSRQSTSESSSPFHLRYTRLYSCSLISIHARHLLQMCRSLSHLRQLCFSFFLFLNNKVAQITHLDMNESNCYILLPL